MPMSDYEILSLCIQVMELLLILLVAFIGIRNNK